MRFLIVGLALVTVSSVASAANITLVDDTRWVRAEGSLYDAYDGSEYQVRSFSDEETAAFGAPFLGTVSISGVSSTGAGSVDAEGTHESSVTFSTVDSLDVVEIDVNMALAVSSDEIITDDFEPVDRVDVLSEAVVDLTLHSEKPLRFELIGNMETAGGDGEVEFKGFGVDKWRGATGSDSISFHRTGTVAAGAHRFMARLTAYSFFIEQGSISEAQITLRAVAIPEPATGVMMGLVTVGVLGLRRRSSGGRTHVRN